jgi:large subunit ribosomal protein L6
MKNIFKTKILIPSDVQLFIKNNILYVKGSKGTIALDIAFFNNKKDLFYSSFFRLFQKAIVGVSLSFVVRLLFVGVGFRVESLDKDFIKLKLGFSHFVSVKIPKNVEVFSPKKTLLVLKSVNNQILKEFSSKICSFKSPDAYKGKGILYKNQVVLLKEGKKK